LEREQGKRRGRGGKGKGIEEKKSRMRGGKSEGGCGWGGWNGKRGSRYRFGIDELSEGRKEGTKSRGREGRERDDRASEEIESDEEHEYPRGRRKRRRT
jgi:hypothetical protein